MKSLLFIIFSLFTFLSCAQHPAYNIFGENQFKGVNIYNVIQDNKLNYWFATNRGLIIHDGYSYKTGICDEIKGSSVFGFVKDSKNIVYCYNLHRQVFKIKDGKLELFYEIPSELAYHEVSLILDQNDNLLIQGKGLIQISPDKKSIKVLSNLLFKNEANPVNIQLLPNGATISTSSKFDLVYQKDGKLEAFKPNNNASPFYNSFRSSFKWLTINNKVYAITRDKLDVYEFNTSSFQFEYVKTLDAKLSSQTLRFYAINNELWIAGISSGCYVYDKDLNPKYNNELLYANRFISDIYLDDEKNLLLSTFDEGVMTIQSNDVFGYNLPNNEKITRISSDNKGSIFLGSNVGNIYNYKNDKLNLLFSDRLKKGNEGIYFWEEHESLVFYTSEGAQFSKWDGNSLINLVKCSGALKSVHFTDKQEALLGFNYGVIRTITGNNSKFKFSPILKLTNRTYCVARSAETRSIYSANSNGLLRMTENRDTSIVTYNNKVVYANTLVTNKDKMIVGTKNQGILIYKDDKLTQVIPFKQSILKLKIYLDKIFFLTSKGLFVSDFKGDKIQLINNSAGLSCDNVSDFHIANKFLYITNSEFLLFIPLEKIFTQSKIVPIHFKKILVNDQPYPTKAFNSDQRKVEFNFGVNTIRYRDNIKYKYKLKGFDEKWQLVDYYKNSVTYNALPPGRYTFYVQSVNGDMESQKIDFTFKIDAPFHQKWWFYLLIILLSSTFIGLLFLNQLKKIRKKNKERLQKQQNKTDMLEAELRALRSQMNPHFIFNSLNSIQDLILKEDTDASYDYIVLFADLVRSTLNYSNKDFISIDKELEFLEIYLSLEKLRFKEDFKYKITAKIDKDIKVPSLLIQPFIENALIHGLIHKKGLKKLNIEFTLKDDKLKCTIMDNGIGRAKSKEIQDRQGFHESFALQAIEKRLKILNEQNNMKSGFIINDLFDKFTAIGTEVILTLPYKKLY